METAEAAHAVPQGEKTLPEMIKALYPEITNEDFRNGTIILENHMDGRGDIIGAWDHPTLKRPTDEELQAR